MVRFLLPLLLLLLSGCKPTCPANDLECLAASMELWDNSDDLSEYGTKLDLVDVPTATLVAEQDADNRVGGANADGNLSFNARAPSFTTNVSVGQIFFGFSDPFGQRPGACFTPCPRNAKCLGTSRCTRAVRDGLKSGSGWFRIEYAKQPAEPADFGYTITPAVAPRGGDFVPLLGSDAGVVVGLSDVVQIKLPGPGNNTGGGAGGSGGGATGGGSGSGGGGGTMCSVPRSDCCPDTLTSLCGVPPSTCAECPMGTRKGVVCAAGAACNTMGGIVAGNLICHCN